jgi:hypothetical protein
VLATARLDASESRHSFRELMATCQEQPALFHFQIMLNCRCIYGGSCPPSALLGTAKTLARWIAQFNQHGCPPRGLVTGSAVSSITFAASPARAAIISRIWRAASICSSVGGREPGSGDAGTARRVGGHAKSNRRAASKGRRAARPRRVERYPYACARA